MGFIWMLVIGLVVGIVAKFLMPGADPSGFLMTVLLGIAGSVVAGFLGRAAGLPLESATAGFVMSVLGAMLLLGTYKLFLRSRSLG